LLLHNPESTSAAGSIKVMMKGTEIGITQSKVAGFVRFGRLQQRERPQRIRIPTRRIRDLETLKWSKSRKIAMKL
jgi:hypothetical protein